MDWIKVQHLLLPCIHGFHVWSLHFTCHINLRSKLIISESNRDIHTIRYACMRRGEAYILCSEWTLLLFVMAHWVAFCPVKNSDNYVGEVHHQYNHKPASDQLPFRKHIDTTNLDCCRPQTRHLLRFFLALQWRYTSDLQTLQCQRLCLVIRKKNVLVDSAPIRLDKLG